MGFFALSKKLGATAVTAAVLMMAKEARGQGGHSNGFWWSENNGAAVIYNYDGPTGNIAIPSEIEGYRVTAIQQEAFDQNYRITGVTIPDSVTVIGYLAFAGCANLQSVNISSAGTRIGMGAFASCVRLASLNIPRGVEIGENCFYGCSGLQSVTIQEGVSYIGREAFGSCTSLSNVKLPKTLSELGDFIFRDCTSLRKINLPTTLTYIPRGMFFGCSNLEDIGLASGVADIGTSAFGGCSSIRSITFPKSIIHIDSAAFSGCTSLNKVCFEGNEPASGGDVFRNTQVSQILYQTGTTGWVATFDGLPTVECNQCVGLVTDVTSTGPVSVDPLTPSQGHTNLIMVIHGWTPFWAPTPYSGDASMPGLRDAIQKRIDTDILSGQWNVQFVDWSRNSGGTPQKATRNAARLGSLGGDRVVAAGYTRVHLISHSAGTWMATEIGKDLAGRGLDVSATFLDAYTPGTVAFKFRRSDNNYTPDKLGVGIPLAEHYYHTNWTMWGLGNTLPNAIDHDISALQECAKDKKKNDWHGWPIRWFRKTVENSNYEFANGLGYHIPVSIQSPDTVESCAAGLALEAQNQLLNNAKPTASSARRMPTAITPPPPLPPVFDPEAIAELRAKLLATRAANTNLSATKQASEALVAQEVEEAGSGLEMKSLTFISDAPSFYTVKDFAKLAEVVRGGTGAISTNGDSIQLSTTNFVWGTFSINTTNGFNLGALSYDLAAGCNSIVGLWIDGEPATLIQSAPQDSLETIESFPLSKALGAGNHLLTVSLESLDRTPISATMRELGLYLAVDQPEITSHSITNGQFQLEWEAGAGLKYQAQYTDELTSTNWNNLGSLLTSPTNAIMAAFDGISTNSQRFYRIKMSAE